MTTDALDFDRLNRFINEGRLIRGAWVGKDDKGRETACLMAAMYPPCGRIKSEAACPASLMPPWLVSLSVWIDDSGTIEKWPGHIRRYAAVIGRVVALDPERMEKLSTRIRVLVVREAISHITLDEWGCKAACEQAIEALESGDASAMSAARSAAESAARSAAESAARNAALSAAWCAAASAAESAAEDRLIDGFLVAMEEATA